MLGFVQTWFAPSAHPIGIDLGTDYLRMAQVEPASAEHASASDFRLIAAASAEIPADIRSDPAGRVEFFAKRVRELLARGNFRGRRAVLALPGSAMHIAQVKLPSMAIAKTGDTEGVVPFPREVIVGAGLPMDPASAVIRHLLTGEHGERGILFAAHRSLIEQYVAAAARARLDVAGLNLEPKAIVDCFSHVYRRKSDRDVTSCYVDIGGSATRVVMARGEQILFARMIDIGGDTFSHAAAEALKIKLSEARLLRIKHCPGRASEMQQSPTDLHHVPVEQEQATNIREREIIERSIEEPRHRLTEGLQGCRVDHESQMPGCPVNRLIFVGGEARQRGLCRQIAKDLNLPAQLGDPLVRMSRVSDIGVESGIDRRQPQPAWAVALGLSMGPARMEQDATDASASAAAEDRR